MTARHSITTCLWKSISTSGRAQRSEYWWFLPVGLALPIIAYNILIRWQPGLSHPTQILLSELFLLPLVSVTIRRLQDTGQHRNLVDTPLGALIGLSLALWLIFAEPRWLVGGILDLLLISPAIAAFLGFILALAIPASVIYFLLMGLVTGIPLFGQMILPSQPGPNKYGPNPQGGV